VTWEGLDAEALARLLSVPRLELADRPVSTLDVAHRVAAAGAPAGTLVLADSQTAGRGRAGRPWHSPPGGGIWATLVARPRTPVKDGGFAIKVGLAVLRALDDTAPALGARIKWPNDVIVRHRKAGGVLCEARWLGTRLQWIAVGVGLNVHGPVAPEVADTAIALNEVAPGITRLQVLQALVTHLLPATRDPLELSDRERAWFMERHWRPPSEDGSVVAGIETDGSLVVRRRDGTLDRLAAPA
jgi:BirA family biotin operon repressor/biotin-[acetyl-CoA-carboxylase] ligase